MGDSPPMTGRATALTLAALVVVYVATGLAGLHFATVGGAVTLLWPPTGLSIAAVFLWGRRMLPAVALGAFLVNFHVGEDLATALPICVGNALEAWVGARLLRTWKVDPHFGRRRDVLAIGATAALAPLIAAFLGPAALLFDGVIAPGQFLGTALLWWAGDASGALLLLPLLLTVSVSKWTAMRWPVAALAAGIGATTWFAFAWVPEGQMLLALAVVPYAFLIGAALRYGAFGASSTAVILCAVAVLCTGAGIGPFADPDAFEGLWALWTFISVAGTFSLLVTALNNERETSENAHRVLETRFRRAFENAPTGMAIVTSDQVLLAANATFSYLLGTFNPVGSSLTRWVDANHASCLAKALGASGSTPSDAPSYPIVFRSEQGAERECVVRVTPLGESGHPDSYLLHIEDITPARIAERDRQRLSEQLVHSQRMDGIGQLAGGIAHDLNNILQAVTGNLELISAAPADAPRHADRVASASHAARRASTLTRQLLAFSRRAPMVPEPLDLGTLVRRSVDMLARLVPEGISIDVDAPEGHFVIADAPQIEQVVLNLCVNARDAMGRDGRIALVVRQSSGGDRVELIVEDEGPGVDVALRERIFEPFFTTKGLGQGTGLGLAVVYGIAQAHGGRIWVEEGARSGARMVLSLPVSDPPGEESSLVGAAPAPLSCCRVLIAEDDPDVLDVTEQLLLAEGFQVLTARDGVEAIERYRTAPEVIDVLLFDVVMPRLSGPEAVETLHAESGAIPTILASGYARELAERDFLQDHGVEFLSKPYTRAQLVAAISRAIGRMSVVEARAQGA